MQACPYDALYIDPDTNTAAKCNYCAHRIDIGLEPACVNVCPEHAIISGDMDDPDTEIAQLLSREQVTVRKAEKGTQPNVFYIDGDEASLNPEATEREEQYIWSQQSAGVGHFAKFAEERMADVDIVKMAMELNGDNDVLKKEMGTTPGKSRQSDKPMKSIEALMRKAEAKRVYDTPDKGILWGWEVSAYVWTKAIAAGAIIVPFIGMLFGWGTPSTTTMLTAGVIGLVFLAATGLLLIKDLDQPMRFAYVLLRPQSRSWLVKGGYAITFFGGFVTLFLLAPYYDWGIITDISLWASALTGIVVAIYTAFLFAQAKGRDFWQSPALILYMMTHSLMAGAAALILVGLVIPENDQWMGFVRIVLLTMLAFNLVVTFGELSITHPTSAAKKVADMIVKGRYSNKFWFGAILFGNIIPIAMLSIPALQMLWPVAAVIALVGIYLSESIWVEAPQRIQLS